ncbi:hypothetical protein ACUOA5_32825, partial [Escherichia coli]
LRIWQHRFVGVVLSYPAQAEANRANTRLDAQDYFDCLRCLRMYAE